MTYSQPSECNDKRFRFTHLQIQASPVALVCFAIWLSTRSLLSFALPVDDFVTSWRSDFPGISDAASIIVPMVGGPYDVDWNNDGVFDETGLFGPVTHEFEGGWGIWTIRVRGDFETIRFDYGGDSRKIVSIDQWGTHLWPTMERAFAGASNLRILATDVPDFSATTSMSHMFGGATLAEPDTAAWDTSSVTDMSYMFAGAATANPDTSNWDTSSVTNMRGMFRNAVSANPDTSGWDTSSVTTMNGMFEFAYSANPATAGWDTSSVTDMAYMFDHARAARPDTSGWLTTSVTTMRRMFQHAGMANPDTSSWDTSSVTTMRGMFQGAGFADPAAESWNTASVVDMSYMFMFSGAAAFDRDIGDWDVSNLVDAYAMFNGVALSLGNYENLLIGWDAQILQPGVWFSGGDSHYCSLESAEARANMIATDEWIITDAGQVCPPPTPVTAPDMTPETDTGISNSDDITTDVTPAFFVSCSAAGNLITLYTDNPLLTAVGSHICENPGTEVVDVGAPLVEGINQITYTDTGELESGHSPSLQITIDWLEQTVLEILFEETGGESWFDNSNWLVGSPCADGWYGVTCNLQEQVIGLDLGGNNLVGTLTSALGYLSALESLSLQENQLSGTIPPGLGNLTNLGYLELEYNQLSGAIPTELSTLTNLWGLWLAGNQLSGVIPPELSNLANLEYLNLGQNQLSGAIPPELGDLANLGFLNLGGNQLSGAIPTELSTLTNLWGLWLAGNQLSGVIPPELGNLTNLGYLQLEYNQLSGAIPPELGNLATLGNLNLVGNQLSSTIPNELGALTNLWGLWLAGNQLSGAIPPQLGNLANLNYLGLSDNQLSGAIPPELGNLANLGYLELGGNQLSGAIPPELADLANLGNLDLNGNQLSGAIPVELGTGMLTNLWGLSLAGNQLSGVIPPELANLTNLEYLDLRWNGLYTDDAALDEFLDGIHPDFDWSLTQTVAPTDLQIAGVAEHSVLLAWDPIEYVEDVGRYRAWYGTNPGGPYTDGGATPSKSDSSLAVDGLLAGTPYYFVVRTETDSHPDNDNDLVSEQTAEVDDATLASSPGVYVWPTTGLQTDETGLTDSFMVMLSTQPAANVSFALSSSDPSEGTVDPTLVEFTPANWSIPQEIVVTGVDDADFDTPQDYVIVLEPTVSPDGNYHGLDPDDVSVTNYDDEVTARAILMLLYAATDGDDWINNTNWLIGEPCSIGWYGVTCDSKGRVTGLNLTGNNLIGAIPWQLRYLSTLQELHLDWNQLSGGIPIELTMLTNLWQLSLRGNQLSGAIPLELGSLVNLEYLNLGYNQLGGAIPPALSNLVNLDYLDLGVNQLSGGIPAELGTLENLWHLSLWGNQLSGAIPHELGNLANLGHLDLGGNQLSGGIPVELGALENLRHLSLRGNQLSGAIPPELGALVNLGELQLEWNQLSGGIPSELGALTSLWRLWLGGNQLNGEIPAELGSLTNLWGLSLGSNQLSGAIPPELGNLVNLVNFDLGGNQLSGAIPPELGALTNLWQLSLWDNQLGGAIPPELGDLANLGDLNLGGNQLSGAIPPELGNLANLAWLHLGDNQLSGGIPPELGSLTNLSGLSLGGNQLSGAIPAELGNLLNLEYLDFQGNQLSGGIPSELGSLTNLSGLSLGGNQLSGEIPPDLGDLANLVSLELGGNRLSGAIPAQIGSLENLRALSLRSNQLTGPIPAELANLTLLDWVDLRWNGLYTDNAALDEFLNGVQVDDGNWSHTQTVAPADVMVLAVGATAAELGWDTIEYESDTGRYRVWYSTAPGGPYTDAGATASKSNGNLMVGGLEPGTTYHFVVHTETDNHSNNMNDLVSDVSEEVSVETLVTSTNTITIEKTTDGVDADVAPGPTLTVGDTVTWAYEVTNTSVVTLVNVFVNDTVEGAAGCPKSVLLPGESMTCMLYGTVASGQYSNTGMATALPEGGGAPVGDLDPSHYYADTLIDYCNVISVSGVADEGEALHEACEHLTIGPSYMAEPGASTVFRSGVSVNLVPEVWIDKGATIRIETCGQSLCQASEAPMRIGCHSCVTDICAINPDCCLSAWSTQCVSQVETICGLYCAE